jgi:fatty-acyl-CoA synthase
MSLPPVPPLHDLSALADFEAVPLADRLPGRGVHDVLVAAAAAHGSRPAMTMLMTGAEDETPRQVSYADLLGLVNRAANLFTELAGERPGVAYMLPGLVETHAVLWGAESVGYAVPVNFLLQPDHLVHLLRAAGVRVLVALGPHPVLDIWEKALALRDAIPGLTLVRVAPPGTPAVDGVVDLGPALARQPDDRLLAAPGAGDDVAAYFHTGGTTGAPRLVAHTHLGQLTAALGGAALASYGPDDVVMANLPLFHVAGTIFCGLSPFLAGSRLLVMTPSGMRNPAMVTGFWRLIERYRVTLCGSVPTSLGAVLDVPVDADLSSVRAGFTGAASLPAAVGQRWREVTGTGLYEVYGMTEAHGLIAIDPVGSTGGEGSVGLRLPYTDLQVRRLRADGGLGERVGPGEVGVVTVSGPTVSPGYRDPSHDAGTFVDGTLVTGDLGYLDGSGRVHLTGRSKDLIIRSGHNIDPLMIENALQDHPDVLLAAAVGLPDAYAGEVPVCYVQLRPGADTDADALLEHARATIAERPAWPREIRVVDTIELTAVGKIFKPALRVDVVTRLVTGLLRDELGLAGASVTARAGGRLGAEVVVTLPDADRAALPAVEKVLGEYLFASTVTVD